MTIQKTTRNVLIAALFGLAALLFAPAAANADYGYCQPRCYYKTVVDYVPQRVSYRVKVKTYDHCGYPQWVWQTRYKWVKVAVQRRVKVCY